MTGFEHILSFRRQMYVKEEDIAKIPNNLQVNYDDTNYWIYFSTEKPACFICKEEGHLAKHCKNFENTEHTLETSDEAAKIAGVPQTSATPTVTTTTVNKGLDQDSLNNPLSKETQITGDKRIHSSSDSTSNASVKEQQNKKITDADNFTLVKSTKKKLKAANPYTPEKVKEFLQPALQHITDNVNKYPLNIEKFTQLISDTYGKSNIEEIALKYTSDLNALSSMLYDIHGLIVERKIKTRLTRIRNHITHTNDFTNMECTSDTSSIDGTDTDI